MKVSPHSPHNRRTRETAPGKAPKNPTAEAIYPKGVPDYADTVAKDGSLVVTVGKPVERREKRRATLIEATK